MKYLLPEGFLSALPKKKITRRLNKAEKTIDALFSAPIRRNLQRRRLHKYLIGQDAAIDFDSTFYSMLKGTKCRKIAFFHFSLNNYHRGKKSKIKRLCRKMAVYDNIVLICQKMADEFAQCAPQLSERIKVIYNPIDEAAYKIQAQEYSVPTSDYLLSVGRLEESQKDFTTLIKGYAAAHRRNADIPPLYIVGDGKDRKKLERLAQSEGMEGKISFLGFFPNPAPWIANAKIFLLCSKFEGLPTVLIEALMLDRIIIASDCPTGPSEILNNGKCGCLVPPRDPAAVSDAIINILSDNSLRDFYTENIIIHKKMFSPEFCISQLNEIL